VSAVITQVPAAHGSTALWYLTRGSGMVALLLLSATVVLGIVASVGWTAQRWPRFVSQGLHRSLSLYCIVLVGIHIVSTVADGYVPINLLDAVVPFASPYRPLWVGMGAVAFDLLLAVAVTSVLRRRIGVRAWRAVHWTAYVCWPIAVLHGLGSGSDTRFSMGLAVNIVSLGAVAATLAWRLATSGPGTDQRRRLAAGVAAVVVTGLIVGVAVLGPLQPGWSERSGTSPAVLAQIAAAEGASPTTRSSASTTPTTPVGGASSTATATPVGTSGGLPSAPFTAPATGTYATTSVGHGQVQVHIALRLGTSDPSLVVTLLGVPSDDGGVVMTSSSVTFGPDRGTVSALNGSAITATVTGVGGSLRLRLELQLSSGAVTGTVAASAVRA
jgi:hypothetical protein